MKIEKQSTGRLCKDPEFSDDDNMMSKINTYIWSKITNFEEKAQKIGQKVNTYKTMSINNNGSSPIKIT